MGSSEREQLASCPFCGGAAHIKAVARDWWKIVIDHHDGCMLSGFIDDVIVPQDDESKALLIERWSARRAPASAEAVARMEVLNAGAVTYCVTAAARQLPPGEYLLYAAPQQAPLTPEQREDLLAAALYVTAHDEESAVLQQADAERIAGLLLDLSGFELPGGGITAAKEST